MLTSAVLHAAGRPVYGAAMATIYEFPRQARTPPAIQAALHRLAEATGSLGAASADVEAFWTEQAGRMQREAGEQAVDDLVSALELLACRLQSLTSWIDDMYLRPRG